MSQAHRIARHLLPELVPSLVGLLGARAAWKKAVNAPADKLSALLSNNKPC